MMTALQRHKGKRVAEKTSGNIMDRTFAQQQLRMV